MKEGREAGGGKDARDVGEARTTRVGRDGCDEGLDGHLALVVADFFCGMSKRGGGEQVLQRGDGGIGSREGAAGERAGSI